MSEEPEPLGDAFVNARPDVSRFAQNLRWATSRQGGVMKPSRLPVFNTSEKPERILDPRTTRRLEEIAKLLEDRRDSEGDA